MTKNFIFGGKVENTLKKKLMFFPIILFFLGVLGFILNRKNIILALICLEIIILAITLGILIFSILMDDLLGQTFAIYVISCAGAESAIGLGILVTYFRLRGSITLNKVQ